MKDSRVEITIHQVTEAFAAQLERGEHPSIAEYKEKYPHLADRIDAVFPALLMLEHVESYPPNRKLDLEDSIPQYLGEYEIIQEVGRGGMGIVYEALHTTMRRRVALKVLPKSATEKAGYVSRFLNEARSAGQLHHTNIVPVFEVGEAEGIQFYAMQFIIGENLDRIIEDIRRLRTDPEVPEIVNSQDPPHSRTHSGLSATIAMKLIRDGVGSPTPNHFSESDTRFWVSPRIQPKKEPNSRGLDLKNRDSESNSPELSNSVFGDTKSTVVRSRTVYHQRVAKVGIQAAEALDHAHSRGVLHRDVKPANLILDTGGNIWVTDFGLAKTEASDLTQTGDIIGTLRYMAPERFAGHADRRSDIYSLGLTLYELCTLKCAFDGDHPRLFKDVDNRKAIPPRNIDETIPLDLETIILKAIDSHPDRRYHSAGAMADDLSLFLADRPIKARRTSVTEKLWRVCRRNPMASTMAFCIATLLLLLAIGSFQFAIYSANTATTEKKLRQASQVNLYLAKVDQAQMRRYSKRIGQRYEALSAIHQAMDLLPELNLKGKDHDEAILNLRNEAIAALSLPDLRIVDRRTLEPGWGQRLRIAFDENYDRYAEGRNDGRIRVGRTNNSSVPEKNSFIELPSPGTPNWVIQLSCDGRYLAAIHHKENALYKDVLLSVWDLQNSSDPLFTTTGVTDFEFSKDNQRLVFGSKDHVEVVSLNSGTVIKRTTPGFNPRLVQISHHGNEVAVSERGGTRLEVWSIAGEPELKWSGNVGASNITAMDWLSNRGILAVGTVSGEVYFWRGSLENPAEYLEVHQSEIKRLHIHPDRDLIATDTMESDVRLTNFVADKEPLRVDYTTSLLRSGFSVDGRLGHYNRQQNTIEFWEVAPALLDNFSESATLGSTVRFHPDQTRVVARSAGDSIEFWDIGFRKRVRVLALPGHVDFCFSRDGSNLFTSGENGLQRWPLEVSLSSKDYLDCKLGTPVTLIPNPTKKIALNRSGSTIVVEDSSFSTSAYSLPDGEFKMHFGRHSGLSSLEITADDQFLLTGTWFGKGVGVWDMATGNPVKMLLAEEQNVTPTAHPTDGKRFVSVGGKVRFWRTEDWKEPDVKNRVELFRSKSHFNRDGSTLAVHSRSSEVRLLDPVTGTEIASIETANAKRLVDFKFSPDGNRLALSCFDDLQILDIAKLREELSSLGLDW